MDMMKRLFVEMRSLVVSYLAAAVDLKPPRGPAFVRDDGLVGVTRCGYRGGTRGYCSGYTRTNRSIAVSTWLLELECQLSGNTLVKYWHRDLRQRCMLKTIINSNHIFDVASKFWAYFRDQLFYYGIAYHYKFFLEKSTKFREI